MKVSMVCLTMGRLNIVKECFEHNIKNCGRMPDEIVWVDNGSVDGTADYARQNADILVLNKSNAGVSRGFNVGFMLATGDLIAVVGGAYSKAPNNWLKIMLEVYESSLADGVCIYCQSVELEPGRLRGGEETHAGRKCSRALFLEGFLFPKINLEKFGYYDEFLDPYWPSDVEYTFRVDHHGFKSLVIHDMTIEHCGRGNDTEPMMKNPNGDDMLPYWQWKQAVQWRQEVKDRIHSNSQKGWPILGFNQPKI